MPPSLRPSARPSPVSTVGAAGLDPSTLAATDTALIWLKRDLRLADHAPLSAAQGFSRALAVFIVEPAWLASPECDARHVAFARDCVEDLRRQGLPVLVRCVKECVTDNCVSESIGATSRIKDTIGEVWVDDDQTLRETDWFDVFPDTIPMAQIVETCTFLSALLVAQ